MKKQHTPTPTRLAFDKEKVASLSPADLDQIQGGQQDASYGTTSAGYTEGSSHHDFTCCACTTYTGAEQV